MRLRIAFWQATQLRVRHVLTSCRLVGFLHPISVWSVLQAPANTSAAVHTPADTAVESTPDAPKESPKRAASRPNVLSPAASTPRNPSTEYTPTRAISTPSSEASAYGARGSERAKSAPEDVASPSDQDRETARLSRIRTLTPKCSDKDVEKETNTE